MGFSAWGLGLPDLWDERFMSERNLPGFSGFRVSGFGFRVSGLGFRVSGFGFRVSGLGFRVSGW